MKNLLLIFLFYLIDHLFLIPTTPYFWKSGEYCPSYEHLNSGHFCEFKLGWWRHWHNTNSSIRRFVLKIATLLIEFMRFIYDEIFGFFLKQKIFHLSTKSTHSSSTRINFEWSEFQEGVAVAHFEINSHNFASQG